MAAVECNGNFVCFWSLTSLKSSDNLKGATKLGSKPRANAQTFASCDATA